MTGPSTVRIKLQKGTDGAILRFEEGSGQILVKCAKIPSPLLPRRSNKPQNREVDRETSPRASDGNTVFCLPMEKNRFSDSDKGASYQVVNTTEASRYAP